MTTWTRYSVFALLAACSASTANTAGSVQVVGGNSSTVALAEARHAPDAPPALMTLQGRASPSYTTPSVLTTSVSPTGGVVYGVSPAGSTGATAPGGYFVRGTGGVTSGATTPTVATLTTVSNTRVATMTAPPPPRNVAPSVHGESAGARTRSRPSGMSAGADASATLGMGSMGGVAMEREAMMMPPTTPAGPRPIGVPTIAPMPPVSPITTTGGVRITVGITPEPYIQQPVVEESILTAASVGDVDRRDNYLEYLSRHATEREQLGLDLSRRVRLRVIDASGKPVNAAQITLSGMGVNAAALSHADGYWDFYPNVSAPSQLAQGGTLNARAEVQGVSVQANVVVPPSGDGAPVMLQLPAIVAPPRQPTLDLGFAIDVTGSMGDELEYVHHEVGTIVQKIQAQNPGTQVRVGATFYRDRVDPVVLQQIPFTSDVNGFANAMQGVRASGGGDYPEDMNAGLEAAVNKMAWSDGAAVRVLVLIADAPPQHYPDAQYTYTQAMLESAQRGIRILPVGASGADRSVEYLFRALGAFTSTPYVYLTDDSGVGSSHMEADTDRVGVEKFAELLVRMVSADLHGEGMHEPGPLGPN